MTPLYQKLLAEFLGTFMLVLAAVGSAAASEGLLGQALASGLVLSVLVASFAGVSGAHFNPAVTIAFTVVGRSRPIDAPAYILMQMIAASLAAGAIATLYPEGLAAVARGAALPSDPSISAAKLIGGEALITLLLMIAICGTMIDPRGRCCYGGAGDSQAEAKIGGMGVGFAVAANILALGPATGGSMNPARSFGPALVRGEFAYHGCYWIGPVIGAIVGAVVYEKLMREPAKDAATQAKL